MTAGPAGPRAPRTGAGALDRWRLQSPSGAEVVSLRQLSPRERLRVVAPSLFTTGNMACGFSAILLAFSDRFVWAAALLAVRSPSTSPTAPSPGSSGPTSPFGLQLDSLADLVSFGLAPAVLVHTWALPENPVLAWLSAFFWLACAAFRLARFNVTVDPLADKKYFVGLPSPGATLVVIATLLALRTPEHGPGMLVPVGVSIVPAMLMVSSIRFRSFRGVLSPQTPAGPRHDDGAGRAAAGGAGAGRLRHRAGRRLRLPADRPARRASPPRCASGSSAPSRWRRRAGGCSRCSCRPLAATSVGRMRIDLSGLEASATSLNRTVDALGAEELAAPSLLPGWSRAHVVAHLALNGVALAGVLDAVLRGEPVAMYESDESP